MMLPKPKHLEAEYGAQFSDPSVASAYRFRPPYPVKGAFMVHESATGRPFWGGDSG